MQSSSSIETLIGLSLLGLTAALFMTTLVSGIMLLIGLSARRRAIMGCGRCGYAVHGLESLSCPECGSDLREAGIRMTPTARRWPAVAFAGSASALAILAALVAIGAIVS